MAKDLEWKVFFEGGFWNHTDRDHAGKELRIDKKFEWAGHEWRIPSVYVCGRGLVIDLCMRADKEALRAFMDKWKLPGKPGMERGLSKKERMELEQDNPLTADFQPHIFCNEKELRLFRSCGVSWQPYLEEIQDMEEAKSAMGHYGLPDDCGWTVTRAFFQWNTKRRSEIRKLSLAMEQLPASAPGDSFTVNGAGDCVGIADPASRRACTLTVREYEHEILEEEYVERDGWEYPRHFDVMGYTLEPETANITLQDCSDPDPARKKTAEKEDPFEPVCSCSCFIFPGRRNCEEEGKNGGVRRKYVCSSVHFEPAEQVEWLPVFGIKQFEDHAENLI